MAIPNPYPNIKDGIVSDNTTWSSNKIKANIDAVNNHERCVLKKIYNYDLEKNVYDIIEYPTSLDVQDREHLINAIVSGTVDIFVNDNGIDSYKVNIASYLKTLSGNDGICFFGIISGYDAIIPSELHLFSGSLGLTSADDEFYSSYDDIFNM